MQYLNIQEIYYRLPGAITDAQICARVIIKMESQPLDPIQVLLVMNLRYGNLYRLFFADLIFIDHVFATIFSNYLTCYF